MSAIIEQDFLNFQWVTEDPFLFCAHHLDFYPKANKKFGPAEPLTKRNLGQDFNMKNDWKMYHGLEVPGFPEHPHRGFETVTVVVEGFVDHFDSAGASGRYSNGDVQWMTAGKGMQHSEMFPLLSPEEPNPLHLFQIWLNLPKKDKFVEPHYKMLWSEDIPVVSGINESGGTYEVRVIAGEFEGTRALSPAPESWAAKEENHVDILLVHMSPNSRFKLPSKSETVSRNLYFYEGTSLAVNGEEILSQHRAKLSDVDLQIENNGKSAKFLILQGEPINEPVVQYGPFVMNTQEEIKEAYEEYHVNQFGGWPWDKSDQVLPADVGRVAFYADGSIDRPKN
ncbi:MAG: pirin family protein [Vallitaleaceae bacterium]|jgi:redox-sensitive bicupin YhaK (pirin superfamily)|nr:pirin family protein [Vallitaleaceae bacterium]